MPGGSSPVDLRVALMEGGRTIWQLWVSNAAPTAKREKHRNVWEHHPHPHPHQALENPRCVMVKLEALVSSQHQSAPSFVPIGSVTFKPVWWHVFLLLLLWASLLITIKNRSMIHLWHVFELEAGALLILFHPVMWIHHTCTPNKMCHYSRFKVTALQLALSKWVSSVLLI